MTFRRTPLGKNILLASLAALLLAMSMVGALAPPADAQTTVVGTADFRNAPHLVPGEYADRIVTGDSSWYSIVYTNGTPYNFAVEFQGVRPAGVALEVALVAPTLTPVDGPAASISGNGVEYPAGHTNVWFLKVSLTTSDQIGVEYPILITVDGVQTAGVEDCSDVAGCQLDEEYAALNVALAEANQELELARSQETLQSVQRQIENSQGFIETSEALGPAARTRLARAEATMAQLCAPDQMCEEFPAPAPTTPVVGWILGFAALAFGVYRAIKKLTTDPKPEAAPPRQLSSLQRAQADKAKAKSKKKKK